MTKILFIRHGKPTYKIVESRGFTGLGLEFGALSVEGIKQAKEVSLDPRLQNADLILSSPYTRALQTSAYIGQKVPADIIVENDLHEWIPDLSNQITCHKDVLQSYDQFVNDRNREMVHSTYPYETSIAIQQRVKNVLDRYRIYSTIIVVCHMVVIQEITGITDYIPNCAVVPFDYE